MGHTIRVERFPKHELTELRVRDISGASVVTVHCYYNVSALAGLSGDITAFVPGVGEFDLVQAAMNRRQIDRFLQQTLGKINFAKVPA